MSKTSKKLDRNTIQRVLQLIRPYKGMVILTLTLALITVVTTLLAPVLAGRAVDKIVGPGQVDYQGLGRIALSTTASPFRSCGICGCACLSSLRFCH